MHVYRGDQLRICALIPHGPKDKKDTSRHDRLVVFLWWCGGVFRSVLRLVWQHWFGSKDFALLVAAEGVMDWKKIVASLSHLLQTEE